MKELFNKGSFAKKNKNNNSNILKKKSNRIEIYLNIYMNNYTIVFTKGEYSLIYSEIDSIQVAEKVITNISNNEINENCYIIKNYATIDG